MKEIKEAYDIDADKYVSNEIPMTKREKERFILEAKALRQNLLRRKKQVANKQAKGGRS